MIIRYLPNKIYCQTPPEKAFSHFFEVDHHAARGYGQAFFPSLLNPAPAGIPDNNGFEKNLYHTFP